MRNTKLGAWTVVIGSCLACMCVLLSVWMGVLDGKNVWPMKSGTTGPNLATGNKRSKASTEVEDGLADAYSSVIMQCFTELTPPTAVTHSLSLPFLSADELNLVVAKTSMLQIFKIKTILVELDVSAGDGAQSTEDSNVVDRRINDDDGFESSFLVADSLILRSERASNTKLILVAEYVLSGTVTSMVHVKTLQSSSGGESLLLGFKDAKLSLVEWDPERHGLSTVSIHYYEQEDIDGSPWAPRLSDCVNYLTVDPGNRCAALKFGVRNLAILPFKQGDEDTAMDDWDEELDGPRTITQEEANATNGDNLHEGTPYATSFVLRLSSLDPSLIHPIHLAFLYEYREPTFGILSSTILPSSSLLLERRDQLSYMVFTLDLQQRASTTILAVTGLPYDLFKVIPLPPPVGGVLLVGGNELIHIDQSGKANGVGVNPFAKQSTSFGLTDQADIDLRLEGCMVGQLSLDNGEMLIILSTGELVVLSFRMDGRSVSGLSVRRVAEEAGGFSIPGTASTISYLSRTNIFVGSEDADSVILGWSRKSKDTSRRRSSQIGITSSAALGFDASDGEDEEEDDDDDLYGDGDTAAQKQSGTSLMRVDSANSKSGDYVFRIHDSLPNFAPVKDITLSRPYRPSDIEFKLQGGITGDLELVSAIGHAKSGALSILSREIEPKTVGRFAFEEAQGVWTMSAKKPIAKALQSDQSKSNPDGGQGLETLFDGLMIVSKAANDLSEESAVYALTSAGFEALSGTEFDPSAGGTIEAGTLGNGMRVIQVLKSEVRSYDGDLGLAQILPMLDEETGTEPKIIKASLADPYLLLIRDDASVLVAHCDDDNDLEEIEKEDDVLVNTNWLTGCLYNDTTGSFSSIHPKNALKEAGETYMFLLSAEGTLYIYLLPNLQQSVYLAEGLFFLPPLVSPQYTARRSAAREALTEVLVADLGDTTARTPYLILRGADDDLTMYEPFSAPSTEGADPQSILHFLKISNPHIAKNPDVSAEETADTTVPLRDHPMRAISNIGGYSIVFLPGGSPSFVIRSASTSPKVLNLRGAAVRGLSGFHTAGCDRGFIYVDIDGVARVSQLPSDVNFAELGMAVRKVDIGEDVRAITYLPPMDVYAIGTSIWEEFELPKDDDYHREWNREEISFKPLVERSFIKLMNPINWSVIDTIELGHGEMVICVKTLNLEISETTHERKQMITIGTAISKGEDLPIRGCIYVYDVVIVVPEADRPETNKKLKLVAKEEIPRGAITGISEIGTQGCMVVAQGQKLMVRGLKEDGTLLPVAFMDMNTYVTSIKELPGTGLCAFADALKGVWFVGYTEEPYRMTLFGKQTHDMEVLAVEVLPIGKDLYIIVADADCNIHVLQFDPEHPKSLQGQLLLHRTTFSLGGHLPTTLTLLPRTQPTTILPATQNGTDTAAASTIPDYEILITTATGALCLLSPLSEQAYRRLGTLSNQLSNALYHPCGLNPRAYRVSNNAPEPVLGGRPIVDGALLVRWSELGSQRRVEIAGRLGVSSDAVRDDLEELQAGLGYL